MPQSVTGNALADEFQTTMAQFAPRRAGRWAGFTGWVSAQMFARSLRDVRPDGAVTSTQVFDGCGPSTATISAGSPSPCGFRQRSEHPKLFCYFVGQVSGGKLAAPDNGVRRCA